MGKKIEHKFISLAQFKQVDEGSGGFKGYVTRFGELDDGGDIILAGAYTDTIAQFLKRGFTADSHDWSFGGGMIGYPVSAKEDKIGLLCETRFHSTPDAQSVRTKAQERQAAGLDTFLSIGYMIAGTPVMVYPNDYDSELPKYVVPDQLQASLEKAKEFRSVRVIQKAHLYEYSLVTVPMLGSAMTTGVKSMGKQKKIDIKGMFEEELAEQTNSLYNLFNVLCCVLCEIDYQEDYSDSMGVAYDYEGAIREALGEFTERVVADMVQEEADEEAGEGMTEGDAEGELAEQTGTSNGERAVGMRALRLVDGHSYVAHLKAVVDAAGKLLNRTQARRELRTKEGRMLSSQNESMLGDLADSLEGHAGNIRKLLDSNVKPADASKAGDQERERQLKLDEMERWFIANIVEAKDK